MIAPILLVYLAFKLGDMFIRKTFVYLGEFNLVSVMFIIEILIGVIIPLVMLLSKKVIKSINLVFISSVFVIAGVVLNRINNFILAYNPPYKVESYFPSFGEISVTLGFVALLVLMYRACVMIFPVISINRESNQFNRG